MTVTDDVRFDESSGAWLSKEEVERFEMMSSLSEGRTDFFPSDVAVVFGAGGGGTGAYLRQRAKVASLILVEHRPDKLDVLAKSFRGSRGLTLLDMDPVEDMGDILSRYAPTVAVLDLHGLEVRPAVIRALAQPNYGLEVLWLIYGPHGNAEQQQQQQQQQQGLDEMLRCWHDPPFGVETCLDPIIVYAR